MKVSEFTVRLIPSLILLSFFIGVGGQPAEAQSPNNTLFVANTTCSGCTAVPPVGLVPGVGTPETPVTFSGLPVTLNGTNYGAVAKFGGGNGGPTGWVHVSYTIPAGTPSGNYTLQFEVSHVGDTGYASALAIDHIVSPNFNESFENDGVLPPNWTVSGDASGFTGLTGGASSATPNLAPTDGSFFAWITNGCQFADSGNPNGCNNTLASLSTSYGSLYQGPGTNGLPAGQGLGNPTLGTTMQSPTFLLGAGDTVSFDVNFLTSDGTYGFSDFATAQLILVSLTGSTITPTTLTQQFAFNPQVQFDFDYSTGFHAGTITVVNNTVPKISDQGVSPSNYQIMVKGTALADTNCLVDPGQLDQGGFASCPELTIQCTNDSSSIFAGDNCPQSTVRNLFFKHVISTNQPSVPAGSAPTMAMGSDNWTTTSCVLAGPEVGQLCPKSVGTEFNDCCGAGASITHSNSTFVAGCCEREWTTTPTIPLWSNSTSIPVSFASAPPVIPIPNPNNWVASPGQSVTFGFEAPGAAPDPTFPIPGDQTLPNPNPPSGNVSAPCGSSTSPLNWGTPGVNPPGFNTNGSVTVNGEGAYELHYFSTDCDEMEELVFNSGNGANNWAMFKTAPFNVDKTNPSVNGLTLNPTTQIPGQRITVSYSCSDSISGGVASGISSCGPVVQTPSCGTGAQAFTVGTLNTGPLSNTFTVQPGLIGPQTCSVTAIDVAGNKFTAKANYFAGYQFFGFFAPVNNAGGNVPPVINVIKGGQAIPIKWQVLDGNGVPVTGLLLGPANGGPSTGTVVLSAINSTVCVNDTVDNTITVSTSGASGLQDLGGGNYQFNWKTNLPKGACVQLSVNPGDGSEHVAYFQAK